MVKEYYFVILFIQVLLQCHSSAEVGPEVHSPPTVSAEITVCGAMSLSLPFYPNVALFWNFMSFSEQTAA